MTRRSSVVLIGSSRSARALQIEYGQRHGEPGSRVGITKPTRAKRKAKRR